MASRLFGTIIAIATWMARKTTITAMVKKWTNRAVSYPPKRAVSSRNCTGSQMARPEARRTLTLKYKDGEKKIFVPADTPIVIYEPGDKTDLKPGAKVFIIAAKQPDGTLQGRAWRVGRDGVTPPM